MGGPPRPTASRRRTDRGARELLADSAVLFDSLDSGHAGAALHSRDVHGPAVTYEGFGHHPDDRPRRLPLWRDLPPPRHAWNHADRPLARALHRKCGQLVDSIGAGLRKLSSRLA